MLSVVITVWNEAKNLTRVVASVKNLAEEIIVVDTGSTDDTIALAKKLGCQVYHHPNPGIVEKVRNFSINKAHGDWILLLDADEEIQPDLSGLIKKTITENQVDYCRIARKNIIFGKWISSDHWWPDYVYRLFKKGAVTWQETIHSIPITIGVGYDFPARENFGILHHNYQSVSQYLDRLNRYTDFQAQELKNNHTEFSWTDLIRQPTGEFLNQYFSRKGYMDGLHGLSLSLLQAVSQLVVYLKLWEKSKFTEASLKVSDLKEELSQSADQFNWWYQETRILQANGIERLIRKIKRRLRL